MRAALLTALLIAGCSAPSDTPRLPDAIAVLGDSISRATNVLDDTFGDRPIHSYATGADGNDTVMSHFERLRALDPALDIVAFNDARAGARMSELVAQAQTAKRQSAQYVVVLLGANDVCAGTDLSEFQAELRLGADAIDAIGAEVLLLSVPDVTKLVDLYGENETARAVWAAYSVCPRVLGPGADLAAAAALILQYNDALEAEAKARGWHWDDRTVNEVAYEQGDVSTADYFHPSIRGQARLAEVTWEKGPYFSWPREEG